MNIITSDFKYVINTHVYVNNMKKKDATNDAEIPYDCITNINFQYINQICLGLCRKS
jgi:hypothetical protein